MDIVVGESYIFKLPNEAILTRARLQSLIGVTKLDGLKVKIKSAIMVKAVTRIRLVHDDVVINYPSLKRCWFPVDCFSPCDFELAVGKQYVCDKKPENANKSWGWASSMTEHLGKPMTCVTVHERDGHYPESITVIHNGVKCMYSKDWVRPFRSGETPLHIKKRNLFNFWPGGGK